MVVCHIILYEYGWLYDPYCLLEVDHYLPVAIYELKVIWTHSFD